ncbi:N-acetylated-alpha-linked acidic dipeptidase-like protein 2 [Eremomyces bilateralis CBS 781.70]|uniref:N-acetylated-alpha-linked acidic dipeptidase-like protein 2 n=1 Tax=Eremomyces bilateralis CBS 781.70 TaxID=1392243 RepID=A0A6G1FVS1_9PEZI|nr:N-acetylated-alpha-linked acidic dipeptidase-like protein 2 [Eremomyces bilateralis CBS 781.70]KAF1809800.1 N-acetylated-alpha-linked acidic dipeptidase-like protein 2 [Eremomyces bilateralis CBS 781.70]
MKGARSIALISLLAQANACIREKNLLERGRTLSRRQAPHAPFPPVLSETESILSNSFDSTSLSEWSHYYTHGLHIAGTNKSQAQWTADRWAENGFTASLAEYIVYLNYPVSNSLTLTYGNGSVFHPKLKEDVLAEDSVTGSPDSAPVFHGYSATGNASAEYVYVGRGQQVDFDRLVALGVPLEGKIALARYGGPFRGLKVKNAQDYGMIGAVIFTDTADDGNVTEANGYAAYPEGPARNPTSAQRGSVQFLSTYPGDPTTPGYPSKEDSPRTDKSPVTPRIPSFPLSWQDAKPLLNALDGHGTNGSEVNRTNWVGALNSTYSTGPAPGAVLSMSNVMRDAITPIWDAIAWINGTNSDETIVIGNHRDAWIVGGAADPNSGSAIMVELSKAFGKLLQTGWKPRRNIVLASWDAEEYGLLGSTEWVEEYIPWLSATTVSYLNIDVGCSGPSPGLSATPELHKVAIETMKKVIWPKNGALNLTMYDVWFEETEGEVGVLGSGSDYTAFLHKGISSLDVGSDQGAGDPIYHYHSNYDTWHWMTTYGDPGFPVHKAVGQYLSLLAYHLADDEVVPFDLPNYTVELKKYFDAVEKTISSTSGSVDLTELTHAIDEFERRAIEIKALEQKALEGEDADLLLVVNHKYRDFQRGFTSQGGFPEREFYQHVAFAPGLDTGYAPVTFPGITEAVEIYKDFDMAQEWVTKTAQGIIRAANIIKP